MVPLICGGQNMEGKGKRFFVILPEYQLFSFPFHVKSSHNAMQATLDLDTMFDIDILCKW